MTSHNPQTGGLPLFGQPAPPASRLTDPETSHLAARSARTTAASHRQQILDALKARGPMTGDELDCLFNWPHATANCRLSDLKDGGLIVRLADSRPTRSGRSAWLWRARG